MILVPSDQKSSAISVVYAHLADITPKVGDVILPDQCVARIGAAPKNGNWFPHLHVQLIRTDYLFQLLGQPEVSRGPVGGASQLEMLDGYGAKEDLAILRERFPDPLKDFPW